MLILLFLLHIPMLQLCDGIDFRFCSAALIIVKQNKSNQFSSKDISMLLYEFVLDFDGFALN